MVVDRLPELGFYGQVFQQMCCFRPAVWSVLQSVDDGLGEADSAWIVFRQAECFLPGPHAGCFDDRGVARKIDFPANAFHRAGLCLSSDDSDGGVLSGLESFDVGLSDPRLQAQPA